MADAGPESDLDAVLRVVCGWHADAKAFKNFHRALCARFKYSHDEKDWRRDQVSLEEHIAKQVGDFEGAEAMVQYVYNIAQQRSPSVTDALSEVIFLRSVVISIRNACASYRSENPLPMKMVAYDLSPAALEGELRNKLKELGWTPPDETSPAAQALQEHIREIGLLRRGDDFCLTLGNDAERVMGTGLVFKLDVAPWTREANRLIDWMMRKCHLLADRPPEGLTIAPGTSVTIGNGAAGGESHRAEPPQAGQNWNDWDGTPQRALGKIVGPTCPVDANTPIRVRFRDGSARHVYDPQYLRWAWTRPYVADADVVAYKVLDLEEMPF